MLLVRGDPLEKLSPGLAPAQVLRCAAQPVIPRDHSAGRCLGHPHGGLLRGLSRVTPEWMRVRVGSSDVRYRFAFHDGLRHASLLRAIPYRRAARPSLMIGIEPAGDFGDFGEVRHCAYAAAEVPDVDAVPLFLLGGGIPKLPDFEHAIEMRPKIFRRFRIAKFAAVLAVSH